MKSPTSKHSKKNNNNKKKPTKKQNKTTTTPTTENVSFACLLPLFFFNSIRMQMWRITWPTKVRCVRASLMGP